jgi:glycosyltransferase involved in cell wall biosynthesis
MDVSLVFVGAIGEDEAAELRDLAERAGAGDRLVILGERGDVPALVASADVLLMTSALEGLPGVVLEACALGTPCVASDLPGVLWIAEQLEGVTPISLSSPDERWADAVEEALRRPRDEAARREALRRLDESVFSMQRAVAAFEALWRSS